MMRNTIATRMTATAMLAMAVASAAQAQELVVNGDFEQGALNQAGAPGWSNFNQNETSGEYASNEGGKSFKAYGPFYTIPDAPPGSGATQRVVPITAGLTYTFSGFLFSPGDDKVQGANLGLAELSFLNAANQAIGGTAAGARYDSNSQADVWIPFSFNRVAPAGATQANIFLGHIQFSADPLTQGGAIFFDDISLKVAAPTTTSNWIASGSGGWLTASNWSGGAAPNAPGATANFGTSINAPAVVSIAGAGATAGTVNFNNIDNSYTIGGAGTLTLDVASGNASLNVALGSHSISAPLALNDTTDVSVAGSGSLTISGALTLNNGAQLRVGSGGALVLNPTSVTGSTGAAVVANGAVITAGTNLGAGVDVNSVGGLINLNATQSVRSISATQSGIIRLNDVATSTVLRTSSLNVEAGSTLNLGDNGAIIDYSGTSPAAAIRTALVAGEAGNWAGTGITSTKAVADSRFAVGYGEASGVGNPTTFLGESNIDSTTLLIRVTFKGDATLNGAVNFDDLVPLAQNYGGSDKVWSQGDFDYDGDVDFDDLVPLAQNYNASISLEGVETAFGGDFAADWALAQSLVPEPTSLAALGLASVLLRRRR